MPTHNLGVAFEILNLKTARFDHCSRSRRRADRRGDSALGPGREAQARAEAGLFLLRLPSPAAAGLYWPMLQHRSLESLCNFTEVNAGLRPDSMILSRFHGKLPSNFLVSGPWAQGPAQPSLGPIRIMIRIRGNGGGGHSRRSTRNESEVSAAAAGSHGFSTLYRSIKSSRPEVRLGPSSSDVANSVSHSEDELAPSYRDGEFTFPV